MTRDEHLEWAKARAREYLDAGDALNAVASILSDLSKHEAWQESPQVFGIMTASLLIDPSVANARRIIEGFN